LESLIFSGLMAAAALAGAVASFLFARQSLPRRVDAICAETRAIAEDASAIAEATARKWTSELADLAALREDIEGMLESVERKRRRTAASASKVQAEAQPADRQTELLRLARSHGDAL
jgi:hypothetical protein